MPMYDARPLGHSLVGVAALCVLAALLLLARAC